MLKPKKEYYPRPITYETRVFYPYECDENDDVVCREWRGDNDLSVREYSHVDQLSFDQIQIFIKSISLKLKVPTEEIIVQAITVHGDPYLEFSVTRDKTPEEYNQELVEWQAKVDKNLKDLELWKAHEKSLEIDKLRKKLERLETENAN